LSRIVSLDHRFFFFSRDVGMEGGEMMLGPFDLEEGVGDLVADPAEPAGRIDGVEDGLVPSDLGSVARGTVLEGRPDRERAEPIGCHRMMGSDVIDMIRMPFVPARLPAVEMDLDPATILLHDRTFSPDVVAIADIAFDDATALDRLDKTCIVLVNDPTTALVLGEDG